MTMNSNNPEPKKAAICIKEQATLVGLSRQRFMMLVKAGVFPAPLYDVATRRPFFSEELQSQCVAVRKKNVGINGKVVMFYARRPTGTRPTPKSKKMETTATDVKALSDILLGVRGLGLATATAAQVRKAVEQLYPQGIAGVDLGKVAGDVFRHLHSKNS